MTPDHISEIALIEVSRAQREAWNTMKCEPVHKGTFSTWGCLTPRTVCDTCGQRVSVEEIRAAIEAAQLQAINDLKHITITVTRHD